MIRLNNPSSEADGPARFFSLPNAAKLFDTTYSKLYAAYNKGIFTMIEHPGNHKFITSEDAVEIFLGRPKGSVAGKMYDKDHPQPTKEDMYGQLEDSIFVDNGGEMPYKQHYLKEYGRAVESDPGEYGDDGLPILKMEIRHKRKPIHIDSLYPDIMDKLNDTVAYFTGEEGNRLAMSTLLFFKHAIAFYNDNSISTDYQLIQHMTQVIRKNSILRPHYGKMGTAANLGIEFADRVAHTEDNGTLDSAIKSIDTVIADIKECLPK